MKDISVLHQLIKSLEDAGIKLEESFRRNDSEKFNEIKKFILQLQKEIGKFVEN